MYPIAIRQRRWPPSSHIPESPSPHASVNNQKRAVERISYYKVWGSGGLPTNSNIDPGGDPEVESPCCWYSMMLLDAVDAGTQCQYYTLSMPGFYLLNPKREGHNSKLPIDLWFCKLPRSELSIHWPKPSLMYAVSVCWPLSYSPQTMLSINWINWINQCRCASLRRLISFSSVRSFRPASHHQTNPIQSV